MGNYYFIYFYRLAFIRHGFYEQMMTKDSHYAVKCTCKILTLHPVATASAKYAKKKKPEKKREYEKRSENLATLRSLVLENMCHLPRISIHRDGRAGSRGTKR